VAQVKFTQKLGLPLQLFVQHFVHHPLANH